MTQDPLDPVAAATHPHPYPYYARLVAERPFHHDPALGAWVAAGAAVVEEVLAHPACRVRPPGEPVPTALLGSPAGELFRHLVRMNDGEAHRSRKHAVSTALGAIDAGALAADAERYARELVARVQRLGDPAELTRFGHSLSIHVTGCLLGLADDVLPRVADEAGALVRCVFPGGTAEEVERGRAAAGRLRERFRALLSSGPDDTLLDRLKGAASPLGPDAVDAVVANAIGFLLQGYDAGAGLLGNTLLALGREPGLRECVTAEPSLLRAVVGEVLRHDAPIQNTRRFIAEPATLGGERVAAGETVLVLLAAANRDPAANPEPHAFDPGRTHARVFTLGTGAHACPGRAVATAVASAGVAALLHAGIEPARPGPVPSYRPSTNARIPLLAWRDASVPAIETAALTTSARWP